jgi:hypothetical protein
MVTVVTPISKTMAQSEALEMTVSACAILITAAQKQHVQESDKAIITRLRIALFYRSHYATILPHA